MGAKRIGTLVTFLPPGEAARKVILLDKGEEVKVKDEIDIRIKKSSKIRYKAFKVRLVKVQDVHSSGEYCMKIVSSAEYKNIYKPDELSPLVDVCLPNGMKDGDDVYRP